MGRADGVHFGTGEDINSGIWDVLTSESPTILNEPEARWWWHDVAARRPNGLTIWRASPDRLPAQDNWDAHAFSRSVFRSLDEHNARSGSYPSDVLLLNELNLNYERGDNADDVDQSQWRTRYAMLAQFLGQLLSECKARAADRGWSPRWWFQGWAPGHGEREYVDLWGPVARRYDGIVYHAYYDRETITGDTLWYAEQFSDHPLLLGEWNSAGFPGDRNAEDAAIRARLRSLCAAIPRLQACYFIWAWAQDSGQKTYDIKGVPSRMRLWEGRTTLPVDDWAPPIVEPPAPAPVPEPEPPAPTPEPEPIMPEMASGIDVSNNNGTIDWDAVAAAGITWAYAKVSEGAGYVDRFFPANWAAMKARSIARGGYHFARPSQSSAETEARHFLACLDFAGGLDAGDFVVLDLEDEDASRADDIGGWALAWLRYVEERVGFRPLLYTGRWYIDGYSLDGYPALAEYGLILAAYQDSMPAAPAPWLSLAAWQDTDQTGVPGVTGDHDWFVGGLAALAHYGKPAGAGLPPAARITFDAATPAIPQDDPWSCSVTSLRWAMTAMGRHPSEQWIESTMIAEGVVSQEQGLLDASGAGLAAFIRRQYGEFGFNALSWSGVSFDAVADAAGQSPLLLGGRGWGHWTGVRGYDDDLRVILLANPADGWMGVAQGLSRERFNALGPFSLVQVTHPDLIETPAEPPAEEGEDMARIAELEQQLRDTWGLIGEAFGSRASVYQAVKRIAEARGADGHRLTKAEMAAEANGIRGFLDANRPQSVA